MYHIGQTYKPFEIVLELYIEKICYNICWSFVIRIRISKLGKENEVKWFAFINRLSERLCMLVWWVLDSLVKWIVLFCDSYQLSYFWTTKVLCSRTFIIYIKMNSLFKVLAGVVSIWHSHYLWGSNNNWQNPP